MKFTPEQEDFIYRRADSLIDKAYLWFLLMAIGSFTGTWLADGHILGSIIGVASIYILFSVLQKRRIIKYFQLTTIPVKKEKENVADQG